MNKKGINCVEWLDACELKINSEEFRRLQESGSS